MFHDHIGTGVCTCSQLPQTFAGDVGPAWQLLQPPPGMQAPPPLDTLPPAAGPVMNLEFLLDFVLDFVKPLDWQAVLDSPIPLKVSLVNPTVSNANSSGTLSRPWTGRRFFKHAFLPQLLQSPTQGCFAGSVCTHLPPGLSSAEILLLSCK